MYRTVKTSLSWNVPQVELMPSNHLFGVCVMALTGSCNNKMLAQCRQGSICEFPVYKFNVPLLTCMTLSRSFKSCLNYERRQSSFLSFMWQGMWGKESLSWSQVGAGILHNQIACHNLTWQNCMLQQLYVYVQVFLNCFFFIFFFGGGEGVHPRTRFYCIYNFGCKTALASLTITLALTACQNSPQDWG